jgi:hypothetical protein
MDEGSPDVRALVLKSENNPLLHLDYGAVTKLSRINKGLRRRKSKTTFGFCIDSSSGRWVKDTLNGGDDDGDATVPRPQRIVPIVQDYKNALLLRPVASFDEAQMATLQHALIRGIEIVAELEEAGHAWIEDPTNRDPWTFVVRGERRCALCRSNRDLLGNRRSRIAAVSRGCAQVIGQRGRYARRVACRRRWRSGRRGPGRMP